MKQFCVQTLFIQGNMCIMNIFELHLTHTTFSRVLSCSVPMVDAQEGENKAEGILLIRSAPETK